MQKVNVFQDIVERRMRSAMVKGCKNGKEDTRGTGKKFGKVRIHGEDQTGNLDALCGIKQAPSDNSGTVDFIPFQIQEQEVRGDDKDYYI